MARHEAPAARIFRCPFETAGSHRRMGGRGPSRSTDPTQTSVRPRTWQSGGGGGRAAPRMGQIGVPAPPPDRGRWYAGAIGASSPHGHGPSRRTDPTHAGTRLASRQRHDSEWTPCATLSMLTYYRTSRSLHFPFWAVCSLSGAQPEIWSVGWSPPVHRIAFRLFVAFPFNPRPSSSASPEGKGAPGSSGPVHSGHIRPKMVAKT